MLARRSFPALLFVVAAVAFPSAGWAQMPDQMEADPNVPAKEGFDTGRAIFWAAPNFDPLRNPQWQPLSDALRAGDVSDDAPVLVFEAGGETLVLVSSQMAYHHIAQGDMNGEPWMVTF